jgi:predicted acyl esterase
MHARIGLRQPYSRNNRNNEEISMPKPMTKPYEDWHDRVSKPQYEMAAWEKDIPVTARDGTQLYVDVCRPKAEGKFPALFSMSPYGKDIQHLAPPAGRESDYTRGTGGIESGMTDYFVPRGYVHVHGDPRGIERSGGTYSHFGEAEQQDGADIVEWIARQPWCNGNVGMLGMSYFAKNQMLVATQQPPHLKAIFVHDGYTDMYRHMAYHGGIFNFGFYNHIWRLFPTSTTQPVSKNLFSPEEYQRKLEALRQDRDLRGYPYLYKLTINPEYNPLMLDMLLHPFDDDYHKERSAYVDFDKINIPVFIVSRWSAWAIHLPGAIDAFYNLSVPRKMVITETSWEGGFGRPWYENHDLVLRWYDHFLKGNDTGVMDEAPVRYFVKGTNQWKTSENWPPAGTSYTKFYLHEKGGLSMQPQTPHERPSRFRNEPWQAPGQTSNNVTFTSAPMAQDLEISGPLALHFWASIDSDDCNWFVQVRDVAPDATTSIVSKGWLKASHRELDEEKSTPERPYHKHIRRLETRPNEIYPYQIDIRDTAHVFRPGHRIQVLIKGQDSPWEDFAIWYHVNNMVETEHTIVHDSRYPSQLLVPVVQASSQP